MTYKVQIDDLVRDATPAEVAAIEASQSGPTLDEQIAARQAAVESARAKLAGLGLSDAEVAALLGG